MHIILYGNLLFKSARKKKRPTNKTNCKRKIWLEQPILERSYHDINMHERERERERERIRYGDLDHGLRISSSCQRLMFEPK